jgi:hypothetical protein
MGDLGRWSAQAVLYGLFAAALAVFSGWPPFRQLGDGQALLRLSLLHPGVPVHDCRQRSAEELAKMPPHMRTAQDCPRERSPVRVQVELDGRTLIDESFAPGGLARDGAAAAYRRIAIPAGAHTVRVRVADDARRPESGHVREQAVQLAAGQVLLIDFNPQRGGVIIQ